MARYWVGGSGNWSDTAHWSASLDGAGGQTVPTSADNVYINKSPSADQIINVDVDVVTDDIRITNSGSGSYYYDINFNGYSLTSYGYNGIDIYPSGGSIDFTDSYIKCFVWQVDNDVVLVMTGSTVHVTTEITDSQDAWFLDRRTNEVYIYNNIILEVTREDMWNNASFNNYETSIICENLTLIAPSAGTFRTWFYGNADDHYLSTITVNGDFTCTASIENNSLAHLCHFNIIKTSGTVKLENCWLSNCNASGGAVFDVSTAYGNVDDLESYGINTGWDFTDPHERYWIGNGGDWNDRSHWSLTSGGVSGCSVPTINDDVFFDSNSITLSDQIITTIGTSFSKSLDIRTEYPITMKGDLLETTSSNLCSAGVPTAKYEWSLEYSADKAFDGDPDTYYYSRMGGSYYPEAICYDFGAGKTVVRYYIKCGFDYITDWTFEGSHDSINWTVLDTQTGQNPQGQTYSINNRTNFRYYRLLITGVDGGVSIEAIEMYDQPDSNICVGGVATASYGGEDVESAFDNDPSTEWYWSYLEPFWLKYDLGDGNEKLATSYILHQYGSGYYASEWTFEGSNDDVNWDILDTQTGQPDTSESVTYTFSNNTAYRYYRMNITNGGEYSWLDIWDILIIGEYTPSTDTYYTLTVPEDDILLENICVGGVATASIENVGYTAENAFDSDIHTSWYYWEGNEPGWLKYDLGEGNEQIALRYILTLYNNDGPSHWTFEGSNDDINWDILDTQTNRPYVDNDDQISLTINISNDIPYRYYRINITNGLGGRWLHIIELEIKSSPTEIPVIVKGIYPELIQYTTLIDSHVVPSGSVYEYYHVIDGGGNDGWTFIPAPQEEYTFTDVQGNHTISVNFIWYEIQEDM
jgi:hypothetical protein